MPEAAGTLTLKEGVDYDIINGEVILRSRAKKRIRTSPTKIGDHPLIGKFMLRAPERWSKDGFQVAKFVRSTPNRLFWCIVKEDGSLGHECSIDEAKKLPWSEDPERPLVDTLEEARQRATWLTINHRAANDAEQALRDASDTLRVQRWQADQDAYHGRCPKALEAYDGKRR